MLKKILRKIVKIDPEKCDGCGDCVPSCAEGAISIIAGKAVLAADNLCDGLGACLGECPQNAISIIERVAQEFDEVAVEKHLKTPPSLHAIKAIGTGQSLLTQWPVQLTLVSPSAPFFQGRDLLITADCVPVAYADYHQDFLNGKAVVMGCPKLDDNNFYQQKLTELFIKSDILSITVVKMEVPCCGGIARAARSALAASGKQIPYKEVTVGIKGDIKG